MGAALFPRQRLLCHVFDADAGKRCRKHALGFLQGRADDGTDQAWAAGRRTFDLLRGTGGAQDIFRANGALRARQLVAAARAADAFEDARMHQCLQNRFEMAWWQLMTGGKGLGRYRSPFSMDRNVKNSGDSENTLTGYQRHLRHRSRLQQLALVVVIYRSRAVQMNLKLNHSISG